MIKPLFGALGLALVAAALALAPVRQSGPLFGALQVRQVTDLASSRPTILVHGYVGCNDVCPLTLQTLSKAIPSTHLRPQPRIVFLDVDPWHDDAKRVRAYVARFPGVDALAAAAPRLRAIQAELGDRPIVRPADVPDHDGRIFVLNEAGVLVGTIAPSTDARLIADEVRALLRHGPIL